MCENLLFRRALRQAVRGAILAALLLFLQPAATAAQSEARDPEALFYFGLYQEIGLGDLVAAIRAYRRIVDAAPKGSELAGRALIREAICLEMLGRKEEALECYARASEDYPGSAALREKVLGEMALFFPQMAPLPEREKEMEALVEEARQFIARGDMEKAKEKLRTALYIDPDNHDIQRELASVCVLLGSHREAAFYYALMLESDRFRRDFALYNQLAECYRNLKDLDSAIRIFRSYLAAGQPDERSEKLAALEIELLLEEIEQPGGYELPWNLRVLLARGARHARQGKFRDAIEIYSSAKAQFPESYLPPYRLGALYDICLGTDPSRFIAAGYYEEALDKAPPATAQRLRHRAAEIYEERGDLEKASHHIEQYFSKDLRPVENDHVLRERIRRKLMWRRIRKLRE